VTSSRRSVLTFSLALLGAVLACALPAGAAAKKLTAANWDLAAQKLVVHSGLMSNAAGTSFAGASPLSGQAAGQAMAALSQRVGAAPLAVQADASVSVVRFDAMLVSQLGLGDVAAHVEQSARGAGLAPPSYFGTEVVARYLGLRYDHPAGEDSLELYPSSPITRAEAAHSLAVVLEAGDWAVEGARSSLEAFSLPHYDADQLKVLRLAVSKIGMPYVWGGTTDDTADGLEHGGYDCSGFAWRVYKVSGFSWGSRILGRTAAEQAGEIAKSARIRLQSVQPGDLLFFGSAHFNSKATEANTIHEGIALSSEWAIHSSGQGVYVLPLSGGWLAQSFTWARRVL
jgi:cell wall-associated NlpC family hydrolase